MTQPVYRESPTGDVQQLKDVLRDVTACLTLNALLTGRDPPFIAKALLDFLARMLQLDLAYIKITDPEGEAVEAVRPRSSLDLNQIRKAVDDWASSEERSVPNPLGNGVALRIARASLGPGDLGTVVVGSAREGFPTDIESFLLNSAVNQAALSLQVARTVQQVKGSERRFRLFVSEVKDYAIFMLDKEGRVVSWNAGAERIKGYEPCEIIGAHFSRFYTPEDIAEEKPHRNLETATREGRFEEEGWRVRKDGSRFWGNVVITALHDESGALTGFGKVVRDLTDQKRMTDELSRSEANLRDFVENAATGLHWVGPDGRILWVNQAELDMLGYTRDEYIGHHINEFHVDREVIESILDRLHRGEILHQCEARMRCKDGSVRDVVIDSSVLFQNREFVHTRCFTRDITARKLAEERLREADRRKDEFLAILGHELRNPLNVISSVVQLLEMDGPRDPKLQEYRGTLETEVKHITRLLDDLLDVSRISRGVIRLKKEPCELGVILRHVLDAHRPILAESELTLSANLCSEPLWVIGDETRLAQVLANFLNNAVKFTDPGGHVTVQLIRDPATASACLTVRDSGIGLEPESLDRIFESFVQVDKSVGRTRGGLGLGLSLVKALVNLHGGQTCASSEGLGRGSEFTVRLPLATTPSVTESKKSALPDRNHFRRILIIEDNRTAAQNLQRFLLKLGHTVEITLSASEGIEAAHRFQPEVVLCDIGLPGMDGYAVARALREALALRGADLIAVSGYGADADQQRGVAAGFNKYLIKPIDLAELQRLIVS